MKDAIIGHRQTLEQLYHAIASNRVAGAYLFVGIANVGKETIALHFAKTINCLTSDAGACGTCLACRKADDGNHPDLQIIRPSGAWIKIDQIRDLQKRIIYRPLEGARKVYILTEAERMNLEAANCLLKTLEEPPADSVLILLTTNLDALLPTIRSRCQIIPFHPLVISELAGHLMDRFNIDESQAFSISTASGGAVGKALMMLQEGTGVDEEIPEIMIASDRLDTFRIAEKWSQQPEALDHLVTWYRDLVLLHQGAPADLLTHVHHAE
ncbi:DNA polymerase III subunit delta', partial [Candidatus Poribacteria bacterium]|nr:DNA polymerase III subunit delta' [Candidatus Poribacteria bacterium]